MPAPLFPTLDLPPHIIPGLTLLNQKAQPGPQQPIESDAQKVHRYTNDLRIAQANIAHHKTSIDQAFLRLGQLACPMQVFVEAGTEKILAFYDRLVVYKYQVNILTRKFEKIRRRETLKEGKKLEVKFEENEEEEYDPEFWMYEVPKELKETKSYLMEHFAEYVPTPINDCSA